MKIAVTSTGPTLDDNVEARFGRCPHFLIIDTETMQFEAIENPNIALGGGAGIQSAQLISEKDVAAVLTGNCGPNAFNVFGQAGIQVIVGVSGPVRNVVEQFKAGAFSSASEPNVASHFGIGAAPTGQTATGEPTTGPPGQGGGRGLGIGGGRGMGRGMGRGGGMGRGMGMPVATSTPSTGSAAGFPQGAGAQMDPERELAALKQQAELLEQQKRQLNGRIAQLEGGRKAVAVVDSGKCAGCGICADVCPAGAIEISEQALVDAEACTGCAACVSECPNGAIVLAQTPRHRPLYYDDIAKLHQAASAIEARYYGKKTRLGEIILFAKELGYKRIGLAFCIGLSEEAKVIEEILSRHFEVASVCCKVCGIDKKDFGLPRISAGNAEVMCNPAGQAQLLNEAETQLNVICGLCVGHDAIFAKVSDAPVITLIAKDRVLAHNPAGAIYSRYVRKHFNESI